jgi:5-formyltetrahydrofolate cyclo-ligase
MQPPAVSQSGPLLPPEALTDDADDAAIRSAKTVLRNAVQFRRDSRPAGRRNFDDAARQDLLEEVLSSRMPDTVAAYLSFGTEPSTLRLVAWLAAQGIRILLPVLSVPGDAGLGKPAWAPYDGPDALRSSRFGILEPTSEPVPAEQLPEAEMIICPGLAANREGDRLGRGGGWYDCALRYASSSAPVWLLLNDDEVLQTIPTHPWDHRVDAIFTQSRMIMCEPRAH